MKDNGLAGGTAVATVEQVIRAVVAEVAIDGLAARPAVDRLARHHPDQPLWRAVGPWLLAAVGDYDRGLALLETGAELGAGNPAWWAAERARMAGLIGWEGEQLRALGDWLADDPAALAPRRKRLELAVRRRQVGMLQSEVALLLEAGHGVDDLPAELALGAAGLLARVGGVRPHQPGSSAYFVAQAIEHPKATAVQRIEAQLDLGDLAGAEALIEQSLRSAPRDPQLWVIRAELARWRRHDDVALQSVEKALVYGDVSGRAVLTRGVLRYLAGDVEAARGDFDLAIAADSHLGEAYAWRGQYWADTGQAAAAVADFDRAAIATLGFAPAVALLRLYNEPPRADGGALDAALPMLCALFPPLARARDLGQSTALWESARQQVPVLLRRMGANRSLRPTLGRGDELQRVDLPPSPRQQSRETLEGLQLLAPSEVVAAQDRIVAALPESSLPLAYRGELALWLGDVVGAEAFLRAALARRRWTRWAYAGLGVCSTLRGDFDEAEHWLDSGLQVMGTEGPPWRLLRGEIALHRGQLTKALELAEQATRSHPGRLAAWILLGRVAVVAHDGAVVAKVTAFLADAAPALWSDAVALALEHEGLVAPADVLERAHHLLQGCRASSFTTYGSGAYVRTVRAQPGHAAAIARAALRRADRLASGAGPVGTCGE